MTPERLQAIKNEALSFFCKDARADVKLLEKVTGTTAEGMDDALRVVVRFIGWIEADDKANAKPVKKTRRGRKPKAAVAAAAPALDADGKPIVVEAPPAKKRGRKPKAAVVVDTAPVASA
jgi:hypothetical protein